MQLNYLEDEVLNLLNQLKESFHHEVKLIELILINNNLSENKIELLMTSVINYKLKLNELQKVLYETDFEWSSKKIIELKRQIKTLITTILNIKKVELIENKIQNNKKEIKGNKENKEENLKSISSLSNSTISVINALNSFFNTFNTSLIELNLDNIGLNEESIKLLNLIPHNSNIINQRNNSLTAPSLKKISLARNNITNKGVCYFIKQLAKLKNLEKIDLTDCSITDEGLKLLSLVCSKMRKLLELNVSYNIISSNGLKYVVSCFSANSNIEYINLENCHGNYFSCLAYLSEKIRFLSPFRKLTLDLGFSIITKQELKKLGFALKKRHKISEISNAKFNYSLGNLSNLKILIKSNSFKDYFTNLESISRGVLQFS